jgi:hypothetical protein
MITRILNKSSIVNISLPMIVNVEDFFRGKRYRLVTTGIDPPHSRNVFHRLFSKFTLSTPIHQHVRLFSVDLQGPSHGLDGVKITNYLLSHPIMVSQALEGCSRQYRPIGRQLLRNILSTMYSLSNLNVDQVRIEYFRIFCF